MVKGVEDFVYNMLVNVFNAQDSAPLALEVLLEAGTHDLGAKATRMEDPSEWTENKIIERAKSLNTDKGPKGDYDD